VARGAGAGGGGAGGSLRGGGPAGGRGGGGGRHRAPRRKLPDRCPPQGKPCRGRGGLTQGAALAQGTRAWSRARRERFSFRLSIKSHRERSKALSIRCLSLFPSESRYPLFREIL